MNAILGTEQKKLVFLALALLMACGRFETNQDSTSIVAVPQKAPPATNRAPTSSESATKPAPAADEEKSTVKSGVDSCLQDLSEGRNKFHVKVSLAALKRLNQARTKYSSSIKDRDVALLVDYSMNSKDKRSFLIDFKNCDVLANEYVIHGGTLYKPKLQEDGDIDGDGRLDKCINPAGTDSHMTRPGAAVTAGCHHTTEGGWTKLSNGCQGINLHGLEARTADLEASGVVLHEHTLIPNNDSIKPVGQGCPAYPPGRLESVLRYGSDKGMLVYLYVPQCS